MKARTQKGAARRPLPARALAKIVCAALALKLAASGEFSGAGILAALALIV